MKDLRDLKDSDVTTNPHVKSNPMVVRPLPYLGSH